MTRRLAGLVLLAACTEAVDPEPLGDYTTWTREDVTGAAPGHGDTYRIIYANELAIDPAWTLERGYQEGAILVKEIRDNVDGMPGDLRYVAIMRRIGPLATGLEREGGWLFSSSSTPNGSERHSALCWSRCHVASPYNGAWYDYRR
ncbi:MAG: cytochrome P460 family protein [Myxococcales bacterium]|nr:cytochrome P460 family protein [Myxococcales bacterium]